MQIKDYVKPELLVVAVVLYFIGMWLKQSETVKDKYIPLINVNQIFKQSGKEE